MTENPYTPPQSVDPKDWKPTELNKKTRSGLGGWLAFVGLSLFASLLIKAATLLQNFSVMGGPNWPLLTTPGQQLYDSMWAPTIILEVILVSMLIVVNIVVLVMYFRKLRSFVMWFVVFALCNVLICGIDIVMCLSIHNFPSENKRDLFKALFQAILYAIIWCLYMKKSTRVANTFVR